MPFDCFLSYASSDLARAEALYEHLTKAGFIVWFDKARLQPGFEWHKEIEQGCEESRIVLPVLTPRWKGSQWTRYETYGAEAIIPIVAEGDWADIATPPLTRWQNHAVPEGERSRLIQAIRDLLAQNPPQKAERVAHLLYRANPYFVGREDSMVEIHEKLFTNPTTALTQGHVEAITALGGVGKTTLAREYAERFWRCYRQMFWVDCRESLTTGFARIHDALRPELRSLPDPDKAAWAQQELNQPERPHRLLILDNAKNEDSVVEWIPKTGQVHTLITSRFTAWSPGIQTHPVWVLPPEPARELLLKRSARTDADAADNLARKLEYLPLALEQAAAYVSEQPQGFGLAQYLDLYQRHERELLAEGRRGSTEYPAPVFLTWRTTIGQLPEGARAILRLHSFFAPTPFPVSVYIAGAGEIAAEAGLEKASEPNVRKWIAALGNYSMIRPDEIDDSFSVHSLVQAVERHTLGDASPATSDRALNLLVDHSPDPSWEPKNRALWEKLVIHAEQLAGGAEPKASRHARLLHRVSRSYYHRGAYRQGIGAAQACLSVNERELGKEHPDTLTSVNDLGYLLAANGDLERAEPLYLRALEARKRIVGKEHPDTLGSVNNLALLFYAKGNLAKAEPLCRQALEGYEVALGKEHPDTLRSVNNLAGLLQAKGDLAGAEPLFRRALEAWERALGQEHPDLLIPVDNLAGLLQDKGDTTGAEPLYRRALEGRERMLGKDHPDTLRSVSNLGELLRDKGDLAGAEPLLWRALEGRERALGKEHPDVLQSVNNLAGLLQAKGDLTGAEALFRRALEGLEPVLGKEHPSTLTAVNNLAHLLQAKGDLAEAEPLFRQALAGRELAQGKEHPDTLASVNNLAGLLRAQGDLAGAEPLCWRAMEGFRRVLGDAHPTAKIAAKNHAVCLAELRKSEGGGWRQALSRFFGR